MTRGPAGGSAAPEPRPGRGDGGARGAPREGWRRGSAAGWEPRGHGFETRPGTTGKSPVLSWEITRSKVGDHWWHPGRSPGISREITEDIPRGSPALTHPGTGDFQFYPTTDWEVPGFDPPRAPPEVTEPPGLWPGAGWASLTSVPERFGTKGPSPRRCPSPPRVVVASAA